MNAIWLLVYLAGLWITLTVGFGWAAWATHKEQERLRKQQWARPHNLRRIK